MRIKSKDTKDNILNMEIIIDKDEFDRARYNAYMSNTDIYPVIDKAPGLATLADLERSYGPAVLFDEALSVAIPESFSKALESESIRIMGRPEVKDVQFENNGGVKFQIKADMYPKVEIGQYKGLAVPYRRMEQQVQFETAVVQKACENMTGDIPAHMVEQKLDSIVAQAKIDVNNDAVYHLLADMLMLLDESYKMVGVNRPKTQVRREALDLMLQTVSSEHEADWSDFFRNQVTVMTERYHELPEDFDDQLTILIDKRKEQVSKFTPEELTEELFKAYLASLELTEEQWRNQRRTQAAKDVCLDLLLDMVADIEEITVNNDEVHAFIEEIAEQCAMSPEEAEANINKEPLVWKLRRDKALAMILDSATTDEAAKAELDEKVRLAKEKASKDAMIEGNL